MEENKYFVISGNAAGCSSSSPQTLESMLAALTKGKPVNESEIPPPVATGAPSDAPQPAVPIRPTPTESSQREESDAVTPSEEERPSSSAPPAQSSLPSPDEEPEGTADVSNRTDSKSRTDSLAVTAAKEATKTTLLERQREYKLAALRAKKLGDLERAKVLFMTSKVSREANKRPQEGLTHR